jgi:octaprenyl-diphosphate synthase
MFDEVKSFVSEELKKVDHAIINLAQNRSELITKITEYLVFSGGKRLRAILTILGAKLFAYQGERHIKLAAAVEAIHTATLLHDDVVDESKLRRGLATVNEVWGNQASVLVGDFLLSQAFQLMVADGSLEILDLLSNASAVISEGEVKQLSMSHELSLREEDYLAIITAKTAELFAASCQIGAIITEQDQAVKESMRQIGLELGIAFQIMDDALDYETGTLGKTTGDDFREGKVTLPVIHALSVASPEDKNTIKQLFAEGGELSRMQELLEKYGSINYSIKQAEIYANRAAERLQNLPASLANNCFEKIIWFTIRRKY